MSTLNERIVDRPKRMPMPTARQMAAATEILERAQGKDARSQTLAPFVADGVVTLHERLDAAGLGEQVILEKLREKLDAEETQFFQKDGIVTDERNTVAHGIQLKATRTALELRGLLSSRGGVHVAASGSCQVNVAMPWTPPAAPSLPQSNDTPTSTQAVNRSPGPGTSTSEGTGNGPGGSGHGRYTAKSVGKSAGSYSVPVESMSQWQLKFVPADVRRAELLRRQNARRKKNPRAKKLVGRNHSGRKGGDSHCKSGKCGRCNKCRLERRRIGTGDDGRPVYAK